MESGLVKYEVAVQERGCLDLGIGYCGEGGDDAAVLAIMYRSHELNESYKLVDGRIGE